MISTLLFQADDISEGEDNMKKRVYISPSTQEANIGLGYYGSEEKRMNEVADIIVPILEEYGVQVFRNTPQMTATGSKDASNMIGVDAHVAIHSNAGGGRGASVFTSGTIEGKKLASYLYRELQPITPADPDRGVKHTSTLVEVVKTKAPAALIEVSFHDNWQDATWIIQNQAKIALAIAKGILAYFEIPYGVKQEDEKPVLPSSPFVPAPEGYEWKLVKK